MKNLKNSEDLQVVMVGAGKTCLVPKEYADAVRNHAPQLRRVG
jgi:oxalate decarboxylase/phosphoglucose isomerase-like protein (cupin superfamily)